MKLYLSYQTFETLFISVPLEPSKDDLSIAEMIVVERITLGRSRRRKSWSSIRYPVHVSHETSYSH